MHFGIQNVSVVVLATSQFQTMSFLLLGIFHTINLATRRTITQNVMFASTLFQQILLVLLNIGHTLSGSRNTARLMNMMALLDVAVANEWSLERLSIFHFMMVESFASSVSTLQSWTQKNANPFIVIYRNFMMV